MSTIKATRTMRIIDALKRIKHLDRKTAKNIDRITENSSRRVHKDQQDSFKPLYSADDIRVMIQQVGDWQRERAKLLSAVHLANATTAVDYRGSLVPLDFLILLKTKIIPTVKEATESLSQAHAKAESRAERDSDMFLTVLMYDVRSKQDQLDQLDDELNEVDTLLDRATLETEISV